MVREQRKRKRWLQPPGFLDLSGHTVPGVATLCQGWSYLRVVAPPAWHKEYQIAKPLAVLMDCTAVPPKDTRGQEALTKTGLTFKGDFLPTFCAYLGQASCPEFSRHHGMSFAPIRGCRTEASEGTWNSILSVKYTKVPDHMDFLKAKVPFVLAPRVRGSTPAPSGGKLRQISRRLLSCHRLLLQHCN